MILEGGLEIHGAAYETWRHLFPVYGDGRPRTWEEEQRVAFQEELWLRCPHPDNETWPTPPFLHLELASCKQCQMPRVLNGYGHTTCSHVQWRYAGDVIHSTVLEVVTHPINYEPRLRPERKMA